jgi:hypothetical protein
MHHIAQSHPALHTAYTPLWTRHSMLPQYCTVHNDVFLPNILAKVTLDRLQYELPNDGHRPKYVGAFIVNFNVNFSDF